MKKIGLGLLAVFVMGLYIGLTAPRLWSDIGDVWSVTGWRITSSGDLVPSANQTYKVGSSALMPNATYLGEGVVSVTVTTTTAVPEAIGALARSSINTGELFIATGTTIASWQKVGAQ